MGRKLVMDMQGLQRVEEIVRKELQRRPVEVDKLDRLWEAAVLITLVDVATEPQIVFEVRAGNLKRQPGEICFPGGKHESADPSLAVTAVRETCEELGLEQEDIELLGELDTFVTFAGPVIHPFVGVLHHPEKIHFNPQEVQEIFTVPLKFFLENEPDCYKMDMADRPPKDFPVLLGENQGGWRLRKHYNVYFYTYEKYVIWGMTARMLYSFLQRCRTLLE